jgi:hypothetical protein
VRRSRAWRPKRANSEDGGKWVLGHGVGVNGVLSISFWLQADSKIVVRLAQSSRSKFVYIVLPVLS